MTHTDTKSTDRKQWDNCVRMSLTEPNTSKSSVLIQAWKGQSHAYVKNGYACVDQKRHSSWKLHDSAPFLRYKDWGGDTWTPDIWRSYFQLEPTGKYETWERAMDAMLSSITQYTRRLQSILSLWSCLLQTELQSLSHAKIWKLYCLHPTPDSHYHRSSQGRLWENLNYPFR